MNIGAVKELHDLEVRVRMTPDSAIQLQKLGHACLIETGAGIRAGFTDEAYLTAGVSVVAGPQEVYIQADVVAKVRSPFPSEVEGRRPGKTLISFFYPAQNSDLLKLARDKGINVVAVDIVPRISRAQKMDALSSMANVAGYRAAIVELPNSRSPRQPIPTEGKRQPLVERRIWL